MSIVKALEFLGKSDILLGSGSPRRLEILSRLGLPFLSQLSIPESVENLDYRTFTEPKEYVLANIRNKLQYALQYFSNRQSRWQTLTLNDSKVVFDGKKIPDLIIAADTVVVHGKEIMEKPKSPEDNARMLRWLSGRTHSVITAVSFCVLTDKDVKARLDATHLDLTSDSASRLCQNIWTFTVETDVTFAGLDESTISWYVDSTEGRDKAGGYGIQGLGAGLIESVNGCFYNVIGFPLNRFLVELNHAVIQR